MHKMSVTKSNCECLFLLGLKRLLFFIQKLSSDEKKIKINYGGKYNTINFWLTPIQTPEDLDPRRLRPPEYLDPQFFQTLRILRPQKTQTPRTVRPQNTQTLRILRPQNSQTLRILRPQNTQTPRIQTPWDLVFLGFYNDAST